MTPSTKAELRRAALDRRAALPDELRRSFAARAAEAGMALARRHGSRIAAAYWPIRGEADPLPLLVALAAGGVTTALPVVEGRGRPLIFRRWRAGNPLMPGPMGLQEPSADSPATHPDLLFVPLAAFDRAGHRIGYGAGYYDATLAALAAKQPLAVGLAFSTQEVASIPAEPHDHPLAFVITERETIECRTTQKHASSFHW
jgi:5-formyltetrahydrofolate cyclo-ligase